MTPASGARLRLTVELPRPAEWEVPLAYEVEERGGRAFLGGHGVLTPTGRPSVQLPLELLPVVHAVDLESDDAIVEFVRTFGPLGAWQEGFLIMRGDTPFRSPAAIKLGPLRKVREERASKGSDPRGEFLDEFRVAAGGLRSLLEIVLDVESGMRFSTRRLAGRWSPYAPWNPPETRAASWRLLRDAVNAGLRSSPLVLWYFRDGEPTDGWEPAFNAGPPFILNPSEPDSLYGLCILELLDHVYSVDRPYRICANETCGRLFSIQEGRSRFGGHRTDTLKYHTPACKAAQESREYRRRQAAKKKGRAK